MYPQFLSSSLPPSPVGTTHSGLSGKLEDGVAHLREQAPETQAGPEANAGSEYRENGQLKTTGSSPTLPCFQTAHLSGHSPQRPWLPIPVP